MFRGSSSKTTVADRGDPNDPRVRLKRDCVGIMAAFKLGQPFHHVVILANTHLCWDPEWADVKLAQAKYLLSRLARFKSLVAEKFECTPSVLLAGDFNSTPGDKKVSFRQEDFGIITRLRLRYRSRHVVEFEQDKSS
ncbi:carbon catabolite repressor protein 4 homolog 4-like [Cucumis sativus]|uniref:carbon catabolite repressor protein 4 homolog 4-like n=1 Tax=Cucumis sativus TaxID=3659 RepID=UPI0012F4D30A|nr:carbon catabolite repressor protein 4 homolog 4-like [Cucumis sativus]